MRTLSLFLFAVSAALPATVTLSTTCNSPTQTVTGLGNCGYSDADGSAQALASGSLTISGNAVNLDARTSAISTSTGPAATFGFSPFSATGSLSITADLTTTGPVRAGYMETFGTTSTSWGGAGYGNSQVSIGSTYSLYCQGIDVCSTFQGVTLIPIELGTTFLFTESQSATGETDPLDSTGDGLVNTQATFKFFEADGLTPVSVFDSTPAPEPSSCVLLALGLLGMAAALGLKR